MSDVIQVSSVKNRERYLLTAIHSHCSISSETKTIGSSSSSNAYDENNAENDLMGSSTACLVSLNSTSSKNGGYSQKIVDKNSKAQLHSIDSNHSQKTDNDGLLQRPPFNETFSSLKETTNDYITSPMPSNEPGPSPFSSLSSKNGTSAKRSGANLTVTFDFDFDDRSIGDEISDTPRNHVFKKVPNFLQKKLFNPVFDIMAVKRQGFTKQEKTYEQESNKVKKSKTKNLTKTRTGVDVIRKKYMAPQPPSLDSKSTTDT